MYIFNTQHIKYTQLYVLSTEKYIYTYTHIHTYLCTLDQ